MHTHPCQSDKACIYGVEAGGNQKGLFVQLLAIAASPLQAEESIQAPRQQGSSPLFGDS
jgi:hypothetical protein